MKIIIFINIGVIGNANSGTVGHLTESILSPE